MHCVKGSAEIKIDNLNFKQPRFADHKNIKLILDWFNIVIDKTL